MAVYSFKAVDERGLKHKGLLEADNTRQLRQQLRSRGLIPLTIIEGGARVPGLGGLRKPRSAFSTKALTAFTHELGILIEGGLPLEKALKLIATQTENLAMRERILSLHAQVTEGSSFAQSLAAYPDDFPPLYRATIAAGEHAGDISGVLGKLADYGENYLKTMGKVKLAMLYPAILAGFSLLVVIGLMVYVFPDITKTFQQSGHALPFLTTALIVVSDVLRHYGLAIVALLLAGALVLKRALMQPEAMLALHRRLLRLPVAGTIIAAINIGRFTSTLSMLRGSGVPLAEALTISSKVMSNRFMRAATEQAANRLIEGASLNQALAQAGCFPASFISMIAGGEASGELDRVLDLAARNQMKELERRIMFGVAILEPVIILTLGLMVLLVVLAIMMPILSMNQLVK